MSNPNKPLDPAKVLEQAAADLRSESAQRGREAEAPTVAELAPSFPSYRIHELIGRGGMGAVYRARHLNLDRDVALKVLPRVLARDPAFEERFLREARALARLDHPHILRVHDFGKAGEWFYLVTEFIDGMNLRQMMQLGKAQPEETLRVVPQICDALHFAHQHGVVHRDIKPENILIDHAGGVKIADFGLAKLIGDASPETPNLTETCQVLGTPHYIAPEQIERPTLVDHRADIFSLGVVFYEMLTGQLPIGRFRPPSEHGEAPAQLDPIVMRSLEPEPDHRYQTVEEMRSDVVDGGTRPAPDPRRQLEMQRQRDRQRGRQEVRASQRATSATILLAAGVLMVILNLGTDILLLALISMVLMAAASLVGFRSLATRSPDNLRGGRLIAAATSAWLPILLLANVMLAGLVATVLPDVSEDTIRTIAAWLWRSMFVADVAVLSLIVRRLSRPRRSHSARPHSEDSWSGPTRR